MDWRTLTDTINMIKSVPSWIMDNLFKKQPVRASQVIEIDLVVGNEKIAPFVRPFAAGVVVNKLGKKTNTVKFPNIRIKKALTAEDTDIERAAGSGLYVTGGDLQKVRDERKALEIRDIKDRIDRTKIWMCWKALSGAISISNDEVEFDIDYNIPNTNKLGTFIEAKRWNETTSDPIADIRNFKKLTQKASGFVGDHLFLGTDLGEAFIKNKAVLKYLDNKGIEVGKMKLQCDDPSMDFIGNFVGVDVYIVAGGVEDLNGSFLDFVPPKEFRFVASKAPFHLEHCVIPDKIGTMVLAEYFAKEWDEEDPAVHWLLGASRPIPVPKMPGAIVTGQPLG
ncbi:MAG: major capsid protein [bacterium]